MCKWREHKFLLGGKATQIRDINKHPCKGEGAGVCWGAYLSSILERAVRARVRVKVGLEDGVEAGAGVETRVMGLVQVGVRTCPWG